jgi:CheY-like chemotaxis protein
MSGECQAASHRPAGAEQRTVLVVEGEVVLRMAVSAHLRDAGFVVIEAVSADEAVEPVSANRAIQLVFSDVMMRGTMNGNELAAWISARYPEIRILLASGIHQHGPQSFVAKPYSFTELQQRIEGMLPDAAND